MKRCDSEIIGTTLYYNYLFPFDKDLFLQFIEVSNSLCCILRFWFIKILSYISSSIFWSITILPWLEWSKLLVIWKVLFNTFLSLSQEYSELTCSGEDWQRDKGALSSELIHSKFNDKYPKIPIFDTIEDVGNNNMSEYCSGDLSIELFSLNYP